MRKESHDCSLGLCIGCKERHDSTFGQSIDPKERHVCTDWLFSVHKIIPKFGYDPKERHDYTLLKRLGPKESHGSFYWQCIGPNESHVRKERHVSLFKHQRVLFFDFEHLTQTDFLV